MKFGKGKECFDFSKIHFPINGFSTIKSDVFSRSFIISADKTVLIVSVELTSLEAWLIEDIKCEIHKRYDIDHKNIWINVTHTFSVPHATMKYQGMPDVVKQSILKSVDHAFRNLVSCEIGYKTTPVAMNVNRNVETDKGWWLGENVNGFSNHEVRLISFVNAQDQCIMGTILNYDVQSDIMKEIVDANGQMHISSDFMGHVCSKLEMILDDDCCVMFLLGAAGDQTVKKGSMSSELNYEESNQLLEILSNEFAKVISQEIKSISTKIYNNIDVDCETIMCEEKIMPVPTKSLTPVKKFDFSLTGQLIPVELETILLGDILLLGTKPELNSSYGSELIKRSPFKNTLVVTMVNGGQKYMPDRIDYDNVTYTAMNSMFAPESAEKVLNGASRLLQRHHQKSDTNK